MTIRVPLTCLSDRRHQRSGRHFFWMWMIIFSDLTVHTGKSLPKGMSAIRKLDDDSLLTIMKDFLGGDCFRVVEKDGASDVKQLAEIFFYTVLWLKFSVAKMDSIVDWADRCMPSSLRLVFFRIMRLWAVLLISPPGQLSSKK